MSLILTSVIYTLVFFLLTAKELTTDSYDHDIDQFMYFGSRILHGELIWTNEFDDKSPIIQYIFSLPAALKNTNIFVLITLIVSIISVYFGYIMLKDMLINSALKINKKTEKLILYFSSILYLTLQVGIYGSLHHINAISASLCLITISTAYINRKKNNILLTNISAIIAAISISIRPYYILNILALPIWLSIREKEFNKNKTSEHKPNSYIKFIKNQLYWVIIITFYITVINITPYIYTGNLADFMYGVNLNSVDYVNHNIFERQYINIGRNPILYPVLIGIFILPLIRLLFNKIIHTYHKITKNGSAKLYKLDNDIIFFAIINPILLEIMFYKKHFFGHYFTLFTPYILISFVFLLSILSRLNKLIYDFKNIKNIFKTISITLFILCLITNQSLPQTISELLNQDISEKSYKVQLVQEFMDQEFQKDKSLGFLAPENNYIHWKLDESRHGFPQKAVFRNIASGKMDNLIKGKDGLNYKFLLPTQKQLCKELNISAPKYIITEYKDYSFNCLKQKPSKYKLLSKTLELNNNNIYIFKKSSK